MAKGKEVGEFSFKFITMTVTPGPAGSTLIACNYEGPVSGIGTVCGTATFVAGKSGTYSSCALGFMDNGQQFSSAGSGSHESSGKHRWHTSGVIERSDSESAVVEGEIDLAGRSWNGKVFENT